MILTCPECATRYSVADNSVGPEGRTVRCTSCGLTWRAEREAPLELDIGPAPPAPEPTPVTGSDDLPRAFRERITAQKQGRQAARSGLALGGAAAGFLLAITSVVLGRNDVVAVWPKAASAYAGLGLSVNSVGLVIEGRPAQIGWENGRPTVLISGTLRNIRKRPVTSPPLRVTLLDKTGREVGVRVFEIANAELPAGGARSFVVKVQNPPESVYDFEATFELGGAARKKAHGAVASHEDVGSEAGQGGPHHSPTDQPASTAFAPAAPEHAPAMRAAHSAGH